eukprot:gene4734-3419_t
MWADVVPLLFVSLPLSLSVRESNLNLKCVNHETE